MHFWDTKASPLKEINVIEASKSEAKCTVITHECKVRDG